MGAPSIGTSSKLLEPNAKKTWGRGMASAIPPPLQLRHSGRWGGSWLKLRNPIEPREAKKVLILNKIPQIINSKPNLTLIIQQYYLLFIYLMQIILLYIYKDPQTYHSKNILIY
jgi:hypothetical protein